MIGFNRYLVNNFMKNIESRVDTEGVVTSTFYGIIRSLIDKRKLILRLNVWPGPVSPCLFMVGMILWVDICVLSCE